MAVFDSIKQWIDKAFENAQSNEEQVLNEQFQEQLDIDSPREELFKQNIFMGDTSRSENIGEETEPENVNIVHEEIIPIKNSEQDPAATSNLGQNETNIPDFLKSDNDYNIDDDVDIVNARSSFITPDDDSFINDPDATQFNPAPVPNDFISSNTSLGSSSPV